VVGGGAAQHRMKLSVDDYIRIIYTIFF